MTAASLPGKVLTCYRSERPGGCAGRFAGMLRALASAGVEVHCACEAPFDLEDPNIHYHLLESPLAGSDSLPAWAHFMLMTPGRLKKLARKIQPEAIAVFTGTYGWLASEAARATATPMIVFCRVRPGYVEGWLESRLARRGYSRATAVVVQAETTREFTARWARIDSGNILVLPNDAPPNPVTAEERRVARRKLAGMSGAPEDALLVISAGRLAPQKRIDTMLQAVSRIDSDRIRLILLGDGPGRRDSEQMAMSLGLEDRVCFAGWRDDVTGLLAGTDLFVSAASFEGAPNSLLEALGTGLACMAADIPEVREILQHEELLFPVGDADALADRLTMMIEDPAVLERARELCTARAGVYTFDWGARLCETVSQALQPRRG